MRSLIGSAGFWCGAAVAMAIVGGVALTICQWSWLSGEEVSPGATIRNMSLIIGVIVAGILALWRISVINRQAPAMAAMTDAARRSVLDERHRNGIVMLRSCDHQIRMAGIRILEKLAAEYPDEAHIAVMTALCADVRDPVPVWGDPYNGRSVWKYRYVEELPLDPETLLPKRPPPVSEDFRAIMDVIRNRSAKQVMLEEAVGFRMDLSDAWFYGAELESINLRGADLSGAVLRSARMQGADLRGANLVYARLDSADLEEADLRDTNLYSVNLSDANLQKADLRGVRIERADMARARLNGVQLSGANLTRVKGLTQEQFDLVDVDPDYPPTLVDVWDEETSKGLVWSGRGVAVTNTTWSPRRRC